MAIDANIRLKDFTFEDLSIEARNGSFDKSVIEGVKLKNVKVNNQPVQ
ncbi:MAG: hypothetical protein M1445_14385 [Bacteroidetes bacterium]|nr:hypothetical protein [Bacteroidota bacterium]